MRYRQGSLSEGEWCTPEVVTQPRPRPAGEACGLRVKDILDQITNGVAINMTLLYLATGESRHADVD